LNPLRELLDRNRDRARRSELVPRDDAESSIVDRQRDDEARGVELLKCLACTD